MNVVSHTGLLLENLRQSCRKNNWAREYLARQLHMNLSTVQRWETKGTKPNYLGTRELNKLFKKNGLNNQLAKWNIRVKYSS